MFTDDELREIHGATLEVLSRTGVFVEDDEAREIFAAAGAEVDRETSVVRLPAHLVEDAVRSAPSTVVMCGRDPARDVVLEDGRVGFTNFGEGIQVVDPYTGELHESRKQDVADCTRIIDALPEIDVVERPLGAHDVPPDTAALHNAEAIFSNTTKHATIGPLTGFCARKMIDMAAAIAGGRGALRRRPILSFLTCPVSPLKLVKRRLRDHHRGRPRRHPGQRALHGDGRRLLARSAGRHARHPQRRGAQRHHAGAAHAARRAGHLRHRPRRPWTCASPAPRWAAPSAA